MATTSLVIHLTKRLVSERYKGTLAGWCWIVAYPLAMVSVYTFVFGSLLRAKWAVSSGESVGLPFSINVFAGLIVFLFVADVVARAPTSISSQPSFVKKIRFPLFIIGIADVLAAFLHAIVSVLVLIAVATYLGVSLQWTMLLVPLILLSIAPALLGVHWMIGAVSVYLRDTEQLIPPSLTLLLFLSPVFYDLSSVTDQLRHVAVLNPLTSWIEGIRSSLQGLIGFDEIFTLSIWAGISLCVCALGLRCFQLIKPGFADVL